MNARLARARQARSRIDGMLLQAGWDFSPRKKSGRRAPPYWGHEARRAPSSRQPHDIASGDRRGCSERDLRLPRKLRH